MLDSAGCGHDLRSMWAAIPFHVGRHYGDVGSVPPMWAVVSAVRGQRDYCPAEFGIRDLPHAPEPLLLHACHLGAKRFPVAFRDGRADHFVDDISEVLQAGDGRLGPGIDHGDVFAGRAQQDGSRHLLQLDPATMKLNCDLLVGGREAGLDASRGQEQRTHFADELCFRLRAQPGSGCFWYGQKRSLISRARFALPFPVTGTRRGLRVRPGRWRLFPAIA